MDFFHNRIKGLYCFFLSNLYKTNDPTMQNILSITGHIRKKVTDEMNDDLLKPYTVDDVRRVLKCMKSLYAPGHPLCFYHNFWTETVPVITDWALDILNKNLSVAEVNPAHISLIPKVKNPKYITEFRPISLCNVTYKIISKCIFNRPSNYLYSSIWFYFQSSYF